MFRDRKEELDRLEAALQASEEECSQEEAFSEEETLPDFDAYNSDLTDEDLEEYSEAVYEGSRPKGLGLLAFLLAALSVVLLALAWWLLKYGGFLG